MLGNRYALFCVAMLLAVTTRGDFARAGEAWDDIRDQLYEGRTILAADGVMSLSTPIRPEDQSAVPVRLTAHLNDGRMIKKVTFIVDENPTPVAAVFTLGGKRSQISLSSKFRLNSATFVRAVVEVDDGSLYMAERFVKFAGGQAACSAPPSGDPEEIASNMGKMEFEVAQQKKVASSLRPDAKIKVSHPNHTGMVLDQISLLYIPFNIVSQIDVRQDDELVFHMEGSMTLSQDPEISFNYKASGATDMAVQVRDSDGGSWERHFPIGAGS